MLVGPPVQVPITGKVSSVACASAANGQAAAPPRIVMNSRRLMFPSDRKSQPTIFLAMSRDMCIAEKGPFVGCRGGEAEFIRPPLTRAYLRERRFCAERCRCD